MTKAIATASATKPSRFSGPDFVSFAAPGRSVPRCLFQLEHIHPFIDGNGRMGRLWQTRLLMLYYPMFEFLQVEHLIHEHQQEYYHALAKSEDLMAWCFLSEISFLSNFLITLLDFAEAAFGKVDKFLGKSFGDNFVGMKIFDKFFVIGFYFLG